MRYFTYVEPDDNGDPKYITVSETEIEKTFYPLWKEKIIKKYGSLDNFCFLDCVDDFCCIHHAWEVFD